MYGLERIDFMGNIITDDSEFGYEVEEENAEVKETREEVENESKPALFFKTYNNIEKAVKDLTGPESRFLWVVCALMSWNNKIVFTNSLKKRMMDDLGIKNKQSIKNLTVSLCKKGFLKKIDMRVYVVNNSFFTKQEEPNVKVRKKAKRKWVDSLKQSTQNDDDII